MRNEQLYCDQCGERVKNIPDYCEVKTSARDAMSGKRSYDLCRKCSSTLFDELAAKAKAVREKRPDVED